MTPAFPRTGAPRRGLARQYCGTLGKICKCQIGVSICAVTDTASCPLDWRLFLPERSDANKLLGQLHHCLIKHVPYDEQAAWSQHPPVEATA